MEDLVKRVWQRCKLMNSLRTDFNDITEIQNKMMKRAVRQLTEKNLERITKEVFDAVKRLLKTRWAYFSLTDLQKARLQLVAQDGRLAMRYETEDAEPVLEVDRSLVDFEMGLHCIQQLINDVLKMQAQKVKLEDDAVRYLKHLSEKKPFTETVWESCCLCIETMMERAS